jgi:hypothetical protein
MDSWWKLGEGSGYDGATLSMDNIECPFCNERGNFENAFHAEKKKPNSGKKLNFDTLKCGNCAGYVQVLWSASEYAGSHCLHDFRVLPRPLRVPDPPRHWPAEVGRCWQQAHRSLTTESWDAAAVMARGALQAALRDQGAKGSNLKTEIQGLADKGILPPLMRQWSDEVRLLAAESAHPDGDDHGAAPTDANDVVEFLDYLLTYLFNLPKAISDYRRRRSTNGDAPKSE